jgi:hypothetical protein
MNFQIPRHEREVVEATALRHYGGDTWKVSEVSFDFLIRGGIRIESRYGKVYEYETMAVMADALPWFVRPSVTSIFCDSKVGCNVFDIAARAGPRTAHAIGAATVDAALNFQRSADPYTYAAVYVRVDYGGSSSIEIMHDCGGWEP